MHPEFGHLLWNSVLQLIQLPGRIVTGVNQKDMPGIAGPIAVPTDLGYRRWSAACIWHDWVLWACGLPHRSMTHTYFCEHTHCNVNIKTSTQKHCVRSSSKQTTRQKALQQLPNQDKDSRRSSPIRYKSPSLFVPFFLFDLQPSPQV